MSKPPIKRVSETELRKMFNEGKYWEQTRTGKLRPKLVANNHPSSPRAKEPICTRSQYIIYVTNKGQKVAGVHQYLRPNGKLGASGRPDPKNCSSTVSCTYLKNEQQGLLNFSKSIVA